jgi:hypothetical protein
MKDKTIEELEKELKEMKESHRSMWDTYGSELCAGDMIRQEEKLEKKIMKLKTIEKWDKSGLLEGLIPDKQLPFFEDPSQIVDN